MSRAVAAQAQININTLAGSAIYMLFIIYIKNSVV